MGWGWGDIRAEALGWEAPRVGSDIRARAVGAAHTIGGDIRAAHMRGSPSFRGEEDLVVPAPPTAHPCDSAPTPGHDSA